MKVNPVDAGPELCRIWSFWSGGMKWPNSEKLIENMSIPQIKLTTLFASGVKYANLTAGSV